MRTWKPTAIVCAACAKRIDVPRQEFRMAGSAVYHVLCARTPK